MATQPLGRLDGTPYVSDIDADEVFDERLDQEFSRRAAAFLKAAQEATGQDARVTSQFRERAQQAQSYANYLSTKGIMSYTDPETGSTYKPTNKTSLAAVPGNSRHELGQAIDVASGPVLNWMRQPGRASDYGLEFLSGDAGRIDPVHLQLARGSQAPQVPPPLPVPRPGTGETRQFAQARSALDGSPPVQTASTMPSPRLRDSASVPSTQSSPPANIPIPPGPGGADRLIQAALSGDPEQIKAAVSALQWAVISGQTSLPEVTNYLQALDKTTPAIAQSIKGKFDANPQLWDLVPQEARAPIQGMFNDEPKVASARPQTQTNRPPPSMPNRRPGQEANEAYSGNTNQGIPRPRERPSPEVPADWQAALGALAGLLPGLPGVPAGLVGNVPASEPSAPAVLSSQDYTRHTSGLEGADYNRPDQTAVNQRVSDLGSKAWTMGPAGLKNYAEGARDAFFEQEDQPDDPNPFTQDDPSLWSAPPIFSNDNDDYDREYNNPEHGRFEVPEQQEYNMLPYLEQVHQPQQPPQRQFINYTNEDFHGYDAKPVTFKPTPQPNQSSPFLMNYSSDSNPAFGPSVSEIGLGMDTRGYSNDVDDYDFLYNNPAYNNLPVVNQPGFIPPPAAPKPSAPAPRSVAPAPSPMPTPPIPQLRSDLTPAELAAALGYNRPSDEEIRYSPSAAWYDEDQYLPDLDRSDPGGYQVLQYNRGGRRLKRRYH